MPCRTARLEPQTCLGLSYHCTFTSDRRGHNSFLLVDPCYEVRRGEQGFEKRLSVRNECTVGNVREVELHEMLGSESGLKELGM